MPPNHQNTKSTQKKFEPLPNEKISEISCFGVLAAKKIMNAEELQIF